MSQSKCENSTYKLLMGASAPEWRVKPPAGLDFAALTKAVIILLPPPGEADTSTDAGYALARMKTLAKKPHAGCPENDAVRRALWLAVGAVAFPGEDARTQTRLFAAAKAAASMTAGDPELRELCGEPAEAIARLLSLATHIM